MKKLIVLTSFLLSHATLGATCYQAKEPTYNFVPKELCFDFVTLDAHREEVALKETNGLLPAVLYPHYVARRNENGYRFIANFEKLNHWPGGCEEGKTLNIVIEGRSDNDGYVEVSYLDVKAKYTYTPDSCHSNEKIGIVTYELKRPQGK